MCTGFASGPGNGARTGYMHSLKRLPARVHEDTREVHDRSRTLDWRRERIGIPHVGLHGVDLPDVAHGLKMAGAMGTPAGGPNAPTVGRQRVDDIPAEKAGTAKHRHKFTVVREQGHLPSLAADFDNGTQRSHAGVAPEHLDSTAFRLRIQIDAQNSIPTCPYCSWARCTRAQDAGSGSTTRPPRLLR